MSAVFLGYISGTLACLISANLLTVINEDIGPNSNYTWFAIVYNLAFALGLVFVSRISDLIGRRWFFIIGNGIGLIGSIICGTAKSIPVFIVGGAFIGLAASVQLSYATVISELVPNKHRGVALGCLALSTIPTQALGPIIGHAFVLHTKQGWRWALYLSIITHFLRQRAISLWRMLDPLGALSFTAGLLLFLLGLSWGGQMYPWKSGQVIGTLVSGVVILVAFIFWEIYGAGEYPLSPMRFFRNACYVGILGTAGIGQAARASIVIIWPIQLTVAGKQKWQMIAALCILTAFLGGMAGTDSTTPTMALVYILITCFAVGYIEVLAFVLGPFCLKPEDLGIALGVIGTSRSTLSSITQALFVTILDNKLTSNIPKYIIPPGGFSQVPGISPQIVAAAVEGNKEAYAQSLKIVYLTGIAFAFCGICSSLLVPNCEEKFTDGVSRRLHGKGIDNTDTTADEPSGARA
ncbi:major facilitator superfamily domain-containing protein [Aspergillus similis]